ncbi:hypothetical protein [Microvirga puerhi]|uniref:Uncharacterized protein n=1 Tax=Microvirga puerhi TaxID=2876078 RepID=A0ABS7VTK7_9HYPH|nr:hypothetical protein [Microvirga puerhi]MBZ6078906.1 hypothetical protein [Microvirga puerhi]
MIERPIDDSTSSTFLTCSSCGFEVDVGPVIEAASRQVASLEKSARQLQVVAICLTALAVALAISLGNLLTLIGGGVLALMIMIQSLLYQYRAWQASHGRLFETQAPILEFLRAASGRTKPK